VRNSNQSSVISFQDNQPSAISFQQEKQRSPVSFQERKLSALSNQLAIPAQAFNHSTISLFNCFSQRTV